MATNVFKKYLSLLAFTAPAFVIYAIFLLYPTFSGLFYSLTDWNGLIGITALSVWATLWNCSKKIPTF